MTTAAVESARQLAARLAALNVKDTKEISTGGCATCGAPTGKRCAGCEDACETVDDAIKTFYCSRVCQTAHWAAHKPVCKRLKAVRALYQAGKLLYKLFIEFRKQTFNLDLDKVEIKDNDITFWMTRNDFPYQYAGPFKHQLFPNEKMMEAVLCFTACSYATFHLSQLIFSMFSGTFSAKGNVRIIGLTG